MPDQDVTEASMPSVDTPEPERRAGNITVWLSLLGLAVVLSVAFFPSFFKAVTSYDDEGSFLVAIRQFMHHGSLYWHTHGTYGPFYFSLASLLFRLTGHDPTLTSGRFIVLVFTALSSAMFGATVWRVTRSMAFAFLCQVSTYIVLVRVAGTEPMHPGSMIVLGLSVLTYAMASYAMDQGSAALIVIGLAVGALLMMKINVGIFAAAAVVIAFVVGNSEWSRAVRVIVGASAMVLPFLLTKQLLYQEDTMALAVIVSIGLLATYASLSVDTISIPPRALLVIAGSAAGAIVVSCIWPLATGTSPHALLHGVVIQPLRQADHLQTTSSVHFDQLSFVLTVLAVVAVLARRYTDISKAATSTRWPRTWQLDAAFGAAGLFVLGLGVYAGFGAWLPAIALIPALAFLSDASPSTRFALRLFVPLAILQFLHVYPVAGSQVAWARVAVSVPAVVAMAAAADRFPGWRQVGPAVRTLAVGAIAIMIVVAAGYAPLTLWHNYDRHVPLGLTGTRLVRVSSKQASVLQHLTKAVQQNCDTFYTAPGFDSLYIYTGLPNPTGQLADGIGVLDGREQRDIASELASARAAGKRVCIVRDVRRIHQWQQSSYGSGPLGKALAPYSRKVARAGPYTVSVRNGTNQA